MKQVGIIGASGYTGIELIKLLSRHPHVELSLLTSEKYDGKEISSIFPSLQKVIEKKFNKLSLYKVKEECDLVFTALPHTTSMGIVAEIIKSGKKVIDLSADYRISAPLQYKQWYNTTHTNTDLLKKAVYGLPELYRESIASANLIANPGCYPTSVILGLAPILKSDLLETTSLIIDSKSGVSGAGRKASIPSQYVECNEDVKAYSICSHRHIPEMEQELSLLAKKEVCISFSPHLVPLTRGILSTLYGTLKKKKTGTELRELYRTWYNNEPFIRIANDGTSVATSHVAGSNYCDIGIHVDGRNNRVIIVSAIDNLGKGAAGQAVQNMNIMCGWDEHLALEAIPSYP